MAKERERQSFRQISIFDPPEPTEPKPSWSEPAEIKADRPEPTEQKPNQLKHAEKGERFEFPPGTPISRAVDKQVFAKNAFQVEKLPGQKWARLAAFKILENTLVYYYDDWDRIKYYQLIPGKVVGLYTKNTAYKPKKLK